MMKSTCAERLPSRKSLPMQEKPDRRFAGLDPATGEVVAEGRSAPIASHYPTAHAEIVALRAAGARSGNYRRRG
jgi:hypothetical protein